MKVITKTWTTPSGINVEVIGTLITEQTNYSDGWNISVPCCDIHIDVKAAGQSQGNWIRDLAPAQIAGLEAKGLTGYTKLVGKLPLTDAQVTLIEEMQAELEASPEWQEKQALIAKNQQETAILNQHGPGWCEKCSSYCFGDCEAN